MIKREAQKVLLALQILYKLVKGEYDILWKLLSYATITSKALSTFKSHATHKQRT